MRQSSRHWQPARVFGLVIPRIELFDKQIAPGEQQDPFDGKPFVGALRTNDLTMQLHFVGVIDGRL